MLPSPYRVDLTREKAKIRLAVNVGIEAMLYRGQKRKRDKCGKQSDTEQFCFNFLYNNLYQHMKMLEYKPLIVTLVSSADISLKTKVCIVNR